MELNQRTRSEFARDVLARYPSEACGLIIGGSYYPCSNTAEDPKRNFKISGEERFYLEAAFGPTRAVLHSHPYTLRESVNFRELHQNPRWASIGDQEGFLADSVAWGIASCDGDSVSDLEWLDESVIQPIESRKFAWFTADCYTLVRDWHRINTKIVLPNFTRELGFWLKGQNIIEDNLKGISYASKIAAEKAELGDIAIFDTFGKGIVNHLGVIVGTNALLHQWIERYSEVSRWDHWKRHAKYVVRLK